MPEQDLQHFERVALSDQAAREGSTATVECQCWSVACGGIFPLWNILLNSSAVQEELFYGAAGCKAERESAPCPHVCCAGPSRETLINEPAAGDPAHTARDF